MLAASPANRVHHARPVPSGVGQAGAKVAKRRLYEHLSTEMLLSYWVVEVCLHLRVCFPRTYH